MEKEILTLEKLAAFCKGRGIIFQGSEIYGGMGNTWDYGPVGVELKNNIKRYWWKKVVQEGDNVFGVDASILMNRKVWEASGHVASFGDPKMDCKECKTRHRADTLIEDYAVKHKLDIKPDAMEKEELELFVREKKIVCPRCGKSNFTEIRNFNPMFETSRGVTDEGQNMIYLRPETAQGEYVNYLNIQRSMRAKLPFGIANVGKAFRNEITPGNFIFRTIEFEQMELQIFCHDKEAQGIYDSYKKFAIEFFDSLGIKKDKLRFKDHDKLAHYAKAACDSQYLFPSIGWQELNGTHHRGTWDLSRHQEYSGKSMAYTDPYTNETFIPTIIEHTIGADRLTLVVLCDAYDEEILADGETRIVMRFSPKIAPYKVAIFPLQKDLNVQAQQIFKELKKDFMCTYDEAGSIGKRYRRQDEIGTPFCITVDYESKTDGKVTVRERDSMKQARVEIANLKEYLAKELNS